MLNRFLNSAVVAARSGSDAWQKEAADELDRALSTDWDQQVLVRDPRTQQVFRTLSEAPASDDDRIRVVRTLEEMNTFSTVINRTRRRDIGEFTTRKTRTIEIEFTSDQKLLHDSLLELSRSILQRRHGDVNVGFMLSTLRRQLSSCVHGLAPLIDDMIKRRLSDLEISEADSDASLDSLDDFVDEVDAVRRAAQSLSELDPKYDAFASQVLSKVAQPNPKVLVFSTFRHTLRYLDRRLSDTSVRFAILHGDTPEHERRDSRRRFALPPQIPER